MANYYRRFVESFSTTARPLHHPTEKSVHFKWTPECQVAFDSLHTQLTSTPILAYPNFKKPFLLDTDASDSGIGAVLSQFDEAGREHVIAYGSRSLTKAKRQYCVTRRELMAVVTFVKHFRTYLLGNKFTLRTDHGSLTWLCNFRDPEGQLARWIELLQEYDFDIVHRQGKVHCNADALCRRPCQQCGREEQVIASVVGPTILSPGKMEEVEKLQREDPTPKPVILAKLAGSLPNRQEQQKASPATRRLYQLWNQLHLIGGTLYCRVPCGKSGSVDKLIIPKLLQSEILEDLHAGVLGGHLGEEKTLNKLKERFYWPGQYNDVRDWCRTCTTCASRKTPTPKPRAPLQSVQTGFSMQLVAVDILGPLPESPAGNKYILVTGDYFTRWMEAYPIPNQEATTVATKLIDELFCRFSIPDCLHSDQGRQFESEIIAHVCKLLNIEKSRTTPYHPQSDGLIERFNRSLIQMLSTCADQHPFDWEEHLPKLVWLITPVSKLLQVTLHSFSCLAGKLDYQWISCMVVTSLALIILSMFRNLGVLSQKPSSGCVNIPDSSRNDNRSSTIEGYKGNPTNLECWSGCSTLLFLEVDTESSTDPGQAPIGS